MLTFLTVLVFFPGGDVYGKAPQAEVPLVSIKELMADPESFLGKVVRVRGTVEAVCPKAGCWLDVSAENNKVRVKVKDGEIVFDAALENREVVAQGTVYKFDLTKEQAVGYYRHLAEEKGEAFDPASVTEGTTIYQLGGIGVALAKDAGR